MFAGPLFRWIYNSLPNVSIPSIEALHACSRRHYICHADFAANNSSLLSQILSIGKGLIFNLAGIYKDIGLPPTQNRGCMRDPFVINNSFFPAGWTRLKRNHKNLRPWTWGLRDLIVHSIYPQPNLIMTRKWHDCVICWWCEFSAATCLGKPPS